MLEAAEEIWDHNTLAAADGNGGDDDDDDVPSLPKAAGLSHSKQAAIQQQNSHDLHVKATRTKIKIQEASPPALPIPVDTDLDELD